MISYVASLNNLSILCYQLSLHSKINLIFLQILYDILKTFIEDFIENLKLKCQSFLCTGIDSKIIQKGNHCVDLMKDI